MDSLLQTPKGFRDIMPEQARVRKFVANKVREIFERYGFEPIETPTVEYASVIMGKYGEEADRLVFRFTDRGDRELALRYDQTVPTARFLAQYQNTLPKYFRRYQIQNVYRAEKPQKGRFREFTQCDFDIFGSTSPIADAEILACSYDSFKNVGFPDVTLRINDRQILFRALERFATETVSVYSLIQTIDKLDKIGETGVREELTRKGLDADTAQQAFSSIQAAEPTSNLNDIMKASKSLGVPEAALQFAPYLARGLDYYTGMIFEIFVPQYGAGSCGGGGRYDNLIKQLGGLDTPATGVAFGFDRMVEAAEELSLVSQADLGATVLVTVFSEETTLNSLEITSQMRASGIRTEQFPAVDKLEKQMKYADRKGIPYVVIAGPEEIGKGTVILKNMASKVQQELSVEKAIEMLI